MAIKGKVFIKCNAKEFDSRDFCQNQISNSNLNCIFLVGDYHIWSFTDVERKSVGLEPIMNTYQLPVILVILSWSWWYCMWHKDKGNLKSSMARSLRVENLLPQNVGSIINYLQSCYWSSQMGSSQLQSTTTSYMDNGVRDGRSCKLAVTPALHMAVSPELNILNGAKAGHKSQGPESRKCFECWENTSDGCVIIIYDNPVTNVCTWLTLLY